MCRAVRCRKCGKTGWVGCGRHVDQVMADVPKTQRCPGHPKGPGDSWLGRLLGRN